MNLMEKYRTKLKKEPLTADSAKQVNDLLQPPVTKPETPLLIESGVLKDRFYLVAHEAQAKEIEQAGSVCYQPEEISSLMASSIQMGEEALKDYLNKIHDVKKAFPGARIEER